MLSKNVKKIIKNYKYSEIIGKKYELKDIAVIQIFILE